MPQPTFRRPVSMTLPVQIVEALDASRGPGQSRSGLVAHILDLYLMEPPYISETAGQK